MLRAGLGPWREAERKMKGPVRGNHPLLLENSVKPVSRHTTFSLSQSLAQEKQFNNRSLVNVTTESSLKKADISFRTFSHQLNHYAFEQTVRIMYNVCFFSKQAFMFTWT